MKPTVPPDHHIAHRIWMCVWASAGIAGAVGIAAVTGGGGGGYGNIVGNGDGSGIGGGYGALFTQFPESSLSRGIPSSFGDTGNELAAEIARAIGEFTTPGLGISEQEIGFPPGTFPLVPRGAIPPAPPQSLALNYQSVLEPVTWLRLKP